MKAAYLFYIISHKFNTIGIYNISLYNVIVVIIAFSY
jgi:hypothetical protein